MVARNLVLSNLICTYYMLRVIFMYTMFLFFSAGTELEVKYSLVLIVMLQ